MLVNQVKGIGDALLRSKFIKGDTISDRTRALVALVLGYSQRSTLSTVLSARLGEGWVAAKSVEVLEQSTGLQRIYDMAKSDGALDSDPPLVLASIFEGAFKKQTKLEGGLFTERVPAKRKGRACTATDSDSDGGRQSGRKNVRKKKKSSSRRVLLAYVEAFEEELHLTKTAAARARFEAKYLRRGYATTTLTDARMTPSARAPSRSSSSRRGDGSPWPVCRVKNTGVGIESD
jgi:hypothetical protein